MLVEVNTSQLTVRDIAMHLGISEWSVTQHLSKGRGAARLPGVKATGTGNIGRGGVWQVQRADYLVWLGVPECDHADRRDAGLPQLTPFKALVGDPPRIATLTELEALVREHHLGHIRVGRSRYFTSSQHDAFTAACQPTPARRRSRKTKKEADV